jgi:cytochrome c oxidase cbb3-type subunit IV
MDYNALRHFADSWGLLYMVLIFLTVLVLVLRPKARDLARDAALIPFREDSIEETKS